MATFSVKTSLLFASLLAPVAAPSFAAPLPDHKADQKEADQASFQANLNEDQVVGILDVANAGEIEAAKIAQSHAKDQRVKDFADRLVKEHQALGEEFKGLTSNLGIKGIDSEKSLKIHALCQRNIVELQAASDADFDKLFLKQQVDGHKKLQTMLDEELIPGLKNDDLKTFFGKVRTAVAEHLTMATQLQEQLGSMPQ